MARLDFMKRMAVVATAIGFLAGATDARATELTFDFDPVGIDGLNFGPASFTTVYGDRGATGSNGTTYSYNGVAANTPNVGVAYGDISDLDVFGYEQWWIAPPQAFFWSTSSGPLNNILWPSQPGLQKIIMFKPDAGFDVVLNSVEIGTFHPTQNTQVRVWESIGDKLDVSTYGVSNPVYPFYNEGTDFIELFDESVNVVGNVVENEVIVEPGTSATVNINIVSDKILWMLIGVVGTPQTATNIAIDNVTFTQAVTGAGTPSDFDFDGDVDGNDLLIIQRGLGTTTAGADINAWRTAFGTGGGATPAAGAVPEPASLALLLSAAAFAGWRRPRGGLK